MRDISFVYCGDFTPGVKIFTGIDKQPWIQNANKGPSENKFSKTIKLIPTVTQIFCFSTGEASQANLRQTYSFPTGSVCLGKRPWAANSLWWGGEGERGVGGIASLTQGPSVEAAHEGEHGVVGAAGGLQAEQRGRRSACGAVGSQPCRSPGTDPGDGWVRAAAPHSVLAGSLSSHRHHTLFVLTYLTKHSCRPLKTA